MEEFKNLNEKMISSEEVFSGRVVHLFKDGAELPNGKHTTREVVRHVGAVAIVPLTDDGKVIVERQFRYPLNTVIAEVPAGKLDVGEDPLDAAKRELKEETGYTAESWIELGKYYPSPAYTDECIHMYLAKDLTNGDRQLDDGEFLNVFAVDFEELVADILNGRIADGKTQTALLKAYIMGNKHG